MSDVTASAIQQIGVGVSNLPEMARWYASTLGFDRLLVEDRAPAVHMVSLAGGRIREKHAQIVVNPTGGGALEFWQSVSPPPVMRSNEAQVGDIRVFAVKIGARERNIPLRDRGYGGLDTAWDPLGRKVRWLSDPEGNHVQQVVMSQPSGHVGGRGGVIGAVLGVRDIENALQFFRDFVAGSELRLDQTGEFPDLAGLPGGARRLRRVILSCERHRTGALADFLGNFELELVSVVDRNASEIFSGRSWGDPGFIHLAFDVPNCAALCRQLEQRGWALATDSGPNFRMGDALGHFAYVSPESGILIELVEISELPIAPQLGLRWATRPSSRARPLPPILLSTLFRSFGKRVA